MSCSWPPCIMHSFVLRLIILAWQLLISPLSWLINKEIAVSTTSCGMVAYNCLFVLDFVSASAFMLRINSEFVKSYWHLCMPLLGTWLSVCLWLKGFYRYEFCYWSESYERLLIVCCAYWSCAVSCQFFLLPLSLGIPLLMFCCGMSSSMWAVSVVRELVKC